MNIENEIFKKMICDFKKLEYYWFVKKGNVYKYSKTILNDSFRTDIMIQEDGKIEGKIYDLDLNEEYIVFNTSCILVNLIIFLSYSRHSRQNNWLDWRERNII